MRQNQLKVSIYGPAEALSCNEGVAGDKHARPRHNEFIDVPSALQAIRPAVREVLQRALDRVPCVKIGRYMAVVVFPDRSNCTYLFQVESTVNYKITDIE